MWQTKKEKFFILKIDFLKGKSLNAHKRANNKTANDAEYTIISIKYSPSSVECNVDISFVHTHTYSLYVGAIPSFRSEYPRTELWHLAREDDVIRQFILVGDSDKKEQQQNRERNY